MRSLDPKTDQNGWIKELLSPGTLITITIVIAGIIGQWFTMGVRLTTDEHDTAVLTKRADDTDRRFERLPKDYVMRTELQNMLNSIREDERDIKWDLRNMQHPNGVNAPR